MDRLAKSIATTALGVRARGGRAMVVRFVAPGELLPDPWGERNEEAIEETLQFYELGPHRLPRRSNDPHGLPHLRVAVADFPVGRLKNGCLRLTPSARSTGPKLKSQTLNGADVDRVLAWLPTAREAAAHNRREAVYAERRRLRQDRLRRREEIVARWRLRQAEGFRPRPTVRSRLSGLVERLA